MFCNVKDSKTGINAESAEKGKRGNLTTEKHGLTLMSKAKEKSRKKVKYYTKYVLLKDETVIKNFVV